MRKARGWDFDRENVLCKEQARESEFKSRWLKAGISEGCLKFPFTYEVQVQDQEGRRNLECLTLGIDKERVLRGQTAVGILESDIYINQYLLFMWS